jgi:hypothetical protein
VPQAQTFGELKSKMKNQSPVRLTKQTVIDIIHSAMSSSTTPPRIKHLIKHTTLIQEQFSQTSRESAAGSKNQAEHPSGSGFLFTRVRELGEECAQKLEEQGAVPAELSIRSRRAFQWLTYLADQKNFQMHWQTLVNFWEIHARLRVPLTYRNLRPRIELAHISPLFRIKVDKHRLFLAVQESYLGAPEPILLAFWQLAYRKNSPEARLLIKKYSRSERFRQQREKLEYLGLDRRAFTQGRCWDLESLFGRVNRRYFGSAIERPHLKWSRQKTYRKFGHYNFETDTVLISRSLDDPEVPAYVLEYLMFHELLHKQLGIHQKGDRQYAHTPEFKAREKTFPQVHQAGEFLAQYSRRLRKES